MSGILLDTGKVSVTIVANTVIANNTVTPETLKQEKKNVYFCILFDGSYMKNEPHI